MKMLFRFVLACSLLLCGCGSDETATRPNDFTPLTAITIVAPTPTLARLTSTRLTAIGNFSGLFTRDITTQVAWSSNNASIADFTSTTAGRLAGLAPGTATVTAALRGVSATLPVTVTNATIATLAITPPAPTLPKGLSSQLTVSGTFSDTSTQDLTDDAAWTSDDPAVASIGNAAADKGLATAISLGTATIGATFDGATATTLLTVSNPQLQGITITPANQTLLSVARGAFHATGHYSDGSAPDITALVAWSSSLPAVATIDGAGVATTRAAGSATIRADLAAVSSSTNLWVTGGNLTAITLAPTSPLLVKDTVTRLSATGTFSNGTTREISGVVDWSVGDASRATIALPGGHLAWLSTLAATASLAPTSIKAEFGTVTATTPLTVTTANLVSNGLTISPASRELSVGTSARFSLSGLFDDGTVQDLTSSATWSSANTTVVTAGNTGLDKGRVRGIAGNSAAQNINATFGGQSVTATATVTARTLQRLSVSAPATTFTPGSQVQFTASAAYSDGTSQDVTGDAVWSIADHDIALAVDSDSRAGLLVAVDSGSTTLTVTFGGKTQALTLVVP